MNIVYIFNQECFGMMEIVEATLELFVNTKDFMVRIFRSLTNSNILILTFLGNCQPGWKHFPNTGLCYKLYSTSTTFDQAQATCAGEDANLVSIHDEETNTFIKDLSDGNLIWLGGFESPPNSNIWTWVDGSSFDYNNWHTVNGRQLEPNGGASEDHLAMSWISQLDGSWCDVNKDVRTAVGFVCQAQTGKNDYQ